MKKKRGYVEVEDIFEALGLDDAAELRAQTLLGVEVCKRIRALKATQKDIAARLGITQPKVSELKHGKFERFSSDRLIALFSALGCARPRRRAAARAGSRSERREGN
jgi:predicted XRE-type DNA-binding protein